MKSSKQIFIIVLIVASIVTIIGLSQIQNAYIKANDAGIRALVLYGYQVNGQTKNSQLYLRAFDATLDSYKKIGSILSTIGGAAILYSVYGLTKKEKIDNAEDKHL